MSDPLPSTAGRIVIRASTLSGYLDCQLRAAMVALGPLFREHGYEIEPYRANVGALVGSGVHGGAEVGLKERMKGGAITPLSTLEDAAVETFRERRRAEKEEQGAVEFIMDAESPTMDGAERQVRRMIRAYRDDVVSAAHPLAVESRIEAEIRPGVILSGKADLLHLDAGSTGALQTVKDLKTGRRRSPPQKHLAQVGSYSLLFRTEGFRPTDAQIDFLHRVKLEKPQPDVEAQPLVLEQAEAVAWATLNDFAEKALAFAKNGDASIFLPNPNSMLCGDRFCRLYGTASCPATRRLAA